jgi:hypothetical protein
MGANSHLPRQATGRSTSKVLGAAAGFIFGFCALNLLFALMFVWFEIDVFHIYIVKPTPPPSGYRTVFDVPMSNWPILVVIGASVVLGKIGSVLGDKIGQRLRRSNT